MQLPALAVQSGDVTNGLLKAQQIAASQQGIQNSQIRNKLLMQQQQDQQAARAQQGQINALASGAVGGDESAMKRLWGADPKLAQTIAGHVSKMDDRQREQAARQANVVGRAAMALHRLKQSGASDQEMAAQYAVYRKGMADSGFDVSGIPEAYTPDLGPRLKAMALESEAVGEMLKEVRWETVTNENGDPVSLRNPVTGEEKSHPRAPKAPLVKIENGSQRTVEEEMALIRAEKRAEAQGKLDVATLEDYRELSASAEDHGTVRHSA